MGAHNDLTSLYQCKSTGNNLISDPGDGRPIHVTLDDGVCLLTLAAPGETRTIDSAADMPIGVRLTLVADQITGSGTCTVEGVSFSAEGDKATLEVIQSNGTHSWSTVGGASAGSLSANTISEYTAASGVTVDGVRLKDGTVFNADLTLDSTNEVNLRFGGVSALAVDDAAITGNTALVDGKSVFISTQDGGIGEQGHADGYVGANFTLTAGVGGGAEAESNGGEAGCISFVTQAGGAGDGAGVAGAAGVIRLNGLVVIEQIVTTKTTTATLTGAETLTGLLSTTGTSYTVTLPTATLLDTALHSLVGANEAFDLQVVNTASGTVTIAVGTGSYTALGLLTFATNVSGCLRFVRTAANTFVIYRIA